MLLNLESGAYAFTADPDEGEVTIGRENDCNFIVKEDGVSRHHCKLWFENEHWVVQDSESRWGTLVNNKQIHKPTTLKTGDVLRLSNVTFMVSLHKTNDHGAIGKQLAGGARDKLKILDDNNRAAAAKPTRMMKSPNKDSNTRLKAALKKMDDEPKVTEEEGVTIIDDSSSDISAAEAGIDPGAETAITSEPAVAPEEAAEEKPSKTPDKKGSKLRMPAKGGVAAKGAKSVKGARAGKEPKEKDEAPKKGSPLVKIVIAAVVLLGGGAAAYFATDGFGANAASGKAKEAETSTGKTDEGANKEAPSTPVIPPKKTDEAPKDENPAQ